MRDGIINYAGSFVARLVGIVLVPFLVHNLGIEQYGVWLAALAFSGMLSIFALGLEWSVERTVAASSSCEGGFASSDLLRAAGTLSLLLGLVGGMITALSGGTVGAAIHARGSVADAANAVFAVTGVTFVVERVRLPYLSIANGSRRFDLVNVATIVEALVRGLGIIILLRSGFGVIAIAMFHLAVRSAGLLALGAIAAGIDWRYAVPFGPFSPKAIRPYLAFGFTTYAAFSMSQAIWRMPPLLIGVVLGSAEIVTYEIAFRFPNAVMLIGGRCGEVLFPEASRFDSYEWVRGTLDSGVRWLMVVMAPLCAILFVIAPQLLGAWLGIVPRGAAETLRVIAIAIFIDAVAIAPQYLAFAGGEIRLPFMVFSSESLLNLVLSVLLLSWMGVTGVAWAILITTSLRACAMLAIAEKVCGYPAVELVRNAVSGLGPALAVSLLFMVPLAEAEIKARWLPLLATATAAIGIYVATLYAWGAREEERVLIHDLLRPLRWTSRA